MARQEIILGTPPSGLGGDPPRVASQKINHMTQELYDNFSVMGTAASADLQTKNNDLAAGKVLVVGAAGWNGGAAIILEGNIDLNSLVTSGIYALNGTYSNGPPGTSATNCPPLYVRVTVHGQGVWTLQEVFGITGDTSAIRYQSSGEWAPWRVVYTSSNVVGVMSGGAIIERGDNASGSYVKFVDGTMMTWGLQTINATVLPGQAISWDVGRQPMPFVGLPSHKVEMAHMSGANGTGDLIYTCIQTYATSGRPIFAGVNMGVLPRLSHPSFTYGTVVAESYFVYFQSVGRWK